MATAQGLAPGFANPLLDPGADLRKAEDNRRILEFQQIDTNGDGRLGTDEIAAYRTRVFAAMDGNGDGAIATGEFLLRRVDLPPSARGSVFAVLDRNGDGRLSVEEFIDLPGTQAADFDGDGTLSIWEYRTRD